MRNINQKARSANAQRRATEFHHKLATTGGPCRIQGNALLSEGVILSRPHASETKMMDRLRIGEIKRLIEHRREPHTLEEDRRMFKAALPHLLRLPVILSSGHPGSGDLLTFAMNWTPAYFEVKGAAHFRRMDQDYADKRTRRPKGLKAKPMGDLVRLTAEERTALNIRTIQAIKTASTPDRVKRRRIADAARRAAAGQTPRAQSATRTKPWEAVGMTRRTWYRKGRPSVPQSFGTASQPIGTDSRAIITKGNVGMDGKPCQPPKPETS